MIRSPFPFDQKSISSIGELGAAGAKTAPQIRRLKLR